MLARHFYKLLLLLLLIGYGETRLLAQGYTDEKRAQYLFFIAQQIAWPYDVRFEEFKLGVYGQEDELMAELEKVRQKTPNIHNKPVKLINISKPGEAANLQVLFIHHRSGGKLDVLVELCHFNSVLLVSEGYHFQESMVSLLVEDGRLRYTINEEMLDSANFKPKSGFVAMALKSRKQWEKQYKEQFKMLEEVVLRTKELRQVIRDQERKIDTQTKKLVTLNEEISEKLRILEERQQRIDEQEKAITDQKQVLGNQKNNIIEQAKKIKAQQGILSDQLKRIKTQRLILILSIISLILVSGLGIVIYRGYKHKKRTNMLLQKKNDKIMLQNAEILQQKEEIETQRDHIEEQRDAIMKQHEITLEQRDKLAAQNEEIMKQQKEITDSIYYARRIQTALLPPEAALNKSLPEHFILNKPRDIVSGDYYWMTQKENKTIIVAADCTGHGVPGAFMSMLGIAFLTEIVNEDDDLAAHDILNQLRDRVIYSLHQTGEIGEQKDGMDMALCIIDKKSQTLEFSGAYNPLYLIRNNELIVVKADKMPVAIHLRKDQSFTRHTVKLQNNDTIYIFSDGYVDQFGGPRGRKFMSKRFKELLMSIQEQPMRKQCQVLDQTIEEWRGDIAQVDDILILGIRVCINQTNCPNKQRDIVCDC